MQATHLTAKARRLTLAAALSLPLVSGLAQSVTPATPSSSSTSASSQDNDTVIELSPFIVDSSKDEGYRATATLAGSRINTELKDIAAPITVLTKEFIKDIAAIDINDFMAYAANTEGSRDFTSSTSSLGKPTDDIASNPNNVSRVRGLQAPNITRDYFFTIGTGVGFDSYNLEQVTISRGPNSILAGLGSPSGIVNFSPALASLARTRHEASYRFGSHSDQRVIVNSNVVARKDTLAFRLAGVYSDRGFKQQPAWNKDQRLYLAGTYKPWRKTTLRASYETIKIDSDNANSITPEDAVTPWILAGRPTYDSASTAPVPAGITRVGTNQPTVTYNVDGTINRAYNINTGYAFFSPFPASVPIFTPQRMYDNRFIDLHETNVNPSIQDRRLRTFTASIDQEILPGLNANVAFVRETADDSYLNLFRTEYAVLSVDVNRNLPGGAANPNFLKTYMQFRGLDNRQINHGTNEVGRASLTYDLNLNKHNKWLGRYRATVFGERRETETEFWTYNVKVAGDLGPETVGYRYYLGDSPEVRLRAVPGHNGLFGGVSNLILNTDGTARTDTLSTFYGLKSDQRNLTTLNTKAAVIQGYLWGDRIVGLYGVREDENESAFRTAVGGSGGIVPPAAPGYPAPSIFTQKTKTYGVVVHPLKWLSVHYNRADNFIPNAGAVDLLGSPTPPPKGTGEDYGFSLRLFEDKLNVKMNWFELTSANGAAGNANFPIAQWTMPYMELTFMPDIARQAGVTYTPRMAAGLITGDPRLANGYTSDNVSKGLELELTYNVRKNWRIMASISKQEAKQTNIASSLTAFIENRLAYWQSIPALWTGPFVGQNVGWGVGRTGQQQWNADNNPYYLAYKSADGKPSTQLAKWRGSLVTNYDFTGDTPLKGFRVGAGGRYIEKPIIGNPAILNAAGTVVGLDLERPYYGHTYIALDAWIGYRPRKKLFNKYEVNFQLNGRDLEQSEGLRPIVANSDGGHPVYRIVHARTFYLTTTVGF